MVVISIFDDVDVDFVRQLISHRTLVSSGNYVSPFFSNNTAMYVVAKQKYNHDRGVLCISIRL
jgi:hypothetical protein